MSTIGRRGHQLRLGESAHRGVVRPAGHVHRPEREHDHEQRDDDVQRPGHDVRRRDDAEHSDALLPYTTTARFYDGSTLVGTISKGLDSPGGARLFAAYTTTRSSPA